MVKGIGDYFSSIKSTEGSYIEQQRLLGPIFKEYGIDLQKKKVSIKGKVLSISFSPSERLSVLLRKEEVLKKINTALQQKVAITDIK